MRKTTEGNVSVNWCVCVCVCGGEGGGMGGSDDGLQGLQGGAEGGRGVTWSSSTKLHLKSLEGLRHFQGYTHSAMRLAPLLGRISPCEREKAEETQEQQ